MFCARCGRHVYYAEQRLALGKLWHSFCFSCYKCRKLLDSHSVNTYCGEIYCNSCYKCLHTSKYTVSLMACRDDCCRPVPCVPCSDPCCSCCDKRPPPPPTRKVSCYRLRQTPEKCVSFQDDCRKVCCSSSPLPHEVTGYYSRNHEKRPLDRCKGGCYCTSDICRCVMEPPKCPPKNQRGRCCSPPPRCMCSCHRRSPSPCAGSTCRCRPVDVGRPVCRNLVYYPPVKCCVDGTDERLICYLPQQTVCTCCESPYDRERRIARARYLNAPRCRRCERKVFAAERIAASGGSFHSCCFNCYCCHRTLEVTSYCEHLGEIYCKRCYTKLFGVQGYD